ncbi:MAG TPA: hypothetical protein DDW52_23775 [Planctomycetaceae bacterium]|nr:hypothetical protein [Planctomycetaceae bacterium]
MTNPKNLTTPELIGQIAWASTRFDELGIVLKQDLISAMALKALENEGDTVAAVQTMISESPDVSAAVLGPLIELANVVRTLALLQDELKHREDALEG